MSRLDRHVAMVQSKLTLGRFIDALAYTSLGFFAVVGLTIVVERLVQFHPPKPAAFFWAGCAVAIVAAFVYSLFRKPTAHEAAVAIDEKLGLKEKFSTALFIRNSNDPFAAAAVKDAERTADNVSLHKRFPLSFPMMGNYAVALAVVVLLAYFFFPTFDLFGREAQRKQMQAQQTKREDAQKIVKNALAVVSSYPKALQSEPAVQIAQKELQKLLENPINDPAQASRSAFKALEESNEAVKEAIKKNEQFATADNDKKLFKTLNPPPDAEGPVADAQRDIAKGDFAKAAADVAKVADKFDQMTPEEQKKAAQQMADMAKQLAQMAQNPAQQQQLQQKLQQMGATPQQAQQMAQTMQQAAQGNQQAQQQLQQMQQQMAQNMNGGKGATPQQQQAMQQMMKQGQAAANGQASAQQMAQAAQQMAQAMQQASAQAGQPGGQKPGQANAGGQPGGQQGMSQAGQQMQQALGQMDAVQKDAEQVAAAQNATQQAADDAAGQCDGNGNGEGKTGKGKGSGQWKEGDPAGKQGNGMGGPGKGGGGGGVAQPAPFQMKQEVAHSKNIDDGRILASTLVKADPLVNKSTIQLTQAAKSAIQDSTDEVDEESVSKESQKVVKDYFETMQNN